MRASLQGLVTLATIAGVLCLLLGWFGSLHPAFDSFSTFRLWFAAGVLVLLVPCFWTSRRVFMIAVLALLTSAILTLPHWPGLKRGWAVENAHIGKPRLRVLQANLLFSLDINRDGERIIRDAAADVLLLQEVSARNEPFLDRLADQYPHQVNCRASRFHSVAILSRLEFAPNTPIRCNDFGGLASAQIVFNNITAINVASFHARWPWPLNQHQQITALAGDFETLKGPTIVAGDFNATPWSHGPSRIGHLSGTQVPAG